MVAEPWAEFLTVEPDSSDLDTLRRHERTGRPLGSPAFVDSIETRLGRVLRPQRVGRKSNGADIRRRSATFRP
jgi:putative transposase